jgi:hypothetical protein
MQHSPAGEDKIHSANQEFFHALRDHKILCRVRKGPYLKISRVNAGCAKINLEE